jgi:hypothetical protein
MTMTSDKSARFEQVFKTAGVPFKEINAYGSQVVVTCRSRDAAAKAASVLQRATFNVLKVAKAIDYNAVNVNTNLCPTTHEVWRVWARA